MNGDGVEWRPTAPLANLRARAALYAEIRRFFTERDVFEVETPVLGLATVTDVHLHSFVTRFTGPGSPEGMTLHLQTSPEFAMKRLLAAGSGAIFQISKVFRDEECGRFHNPEFTMLEWYRPGFDHHQLMDEIEALLGRVAGIGVVERLSYREAFQRYAGIDCGAKRELLRECAISHGVIEASPDPSHDSNYWLDMLLSHVVGPQLGHGQATFIYDFPATQAALAKIGGRHTAVAERFEVFVSGMELANGYHELTDPDEQRRRFDADNQKRIAAGLAPVAVDERLIASLHAGIPSCAGVAMGLDRLMMWLTQAETINEVLAFPIDRA